jgi:hypothetical protein
MPKITIDDMPPAETETLAYWLRRMEPAEVKRLAEKHGVLPAVLKSALDKLQTALVDAVLRPRQTSKGEG